MKKKTLRNLLVFLLVWTFFPLVALATAISYTICWTFYLLYAQTDAPDTQPIVPLSPSRVFKVTYHILHYIYENLTGPFLPSMLQYGWHKLSTERRRHSVRKDIRYGPRARNYLDVYLPDRVSTTVFKNSKGYTQEGVLPTFTNTSTNDLSAQSDCPVIILVCTSWNSGKKSTCMPVAHNLQSQGYVVVVPDITLYPQGKIAEMVSDVQNCIYWTHTHIRQFRGDPSQIYLMGHSAGALLSALAIIHDVCALMNTLPAGSARVNIPVWDNTVRRTSLPRVQGMILFSGIYDVTYYYAYLHQKGLEEVHAMPRVMGNENEAFQACSPMFLLQNAFASVSDRERLKMLLPRKVLLIHGAKDAFNPAICTRTFYDLLVAAGVPSVQLKIYENERHISPRVDLIVPTKRLCVLLLEDIKECCKVQSGVVIMGGGLKEKEDSDSEGLSETETFLPTNEDTERAALATA